MRRSCLLLVVALSFVLFSPGGLKADSLVVRGCGNISSRVLEFRALLGGPSNVATPPAASGRREINWDGVPDAVTNTNTFAGNFFNTNSPRGLVLTTPGTGFRVSNNDFADVNAGYGGEIAAFSTAKTFAPVGSNITEVTFFTPGSTNEATVSAFGVVFSDVDTAGSTSMEFFSGISSLGTFVVPIRCDANGHSFLGVIFDDERVTRVRITTGSAALSGGTNDVTGGGTADIVVMDDLIYSEPIAGASVTSQVLSAVLLGSNEAPGPGDPDGSGFAVISVDPDAGTVGYAISVQGIAAPTAAHIHIGPAGVPGNIVVDLNPTFTNDVATGTVTAVSTDLLEDILANPSGFYVNVHNADFPGGAVRGQLQTNVAGSTQFTFPVVARVPGAAGTSYRTDMRLVNNSGTSTDVLIQFYPGGGTANNGPSESESITLAPGEQRVIDDVLSTQFGIDNGIGAIQLFASRPIVAVARIYNDQRANGQGTFGQFAAGAPSTVASRQTGVLAGLSESPIASGSFRTNVGWFNAGTSEASLTLRAHANDGSVIATQTVTIPAFSQRQQHISGIFSSLGTRENFYISYTTDSSSLYLYASVVDNLNGDAIFVPAL